MLFKKGAAEAEAVAAATSSLCGAAEPAFCDLLPNGDTTGGGCPGAFTATLGVRGVRLNVFASWGWRARASLPGGIFGSVVLVILGRVRLFSDGAFW